MASSHRKAFLRALLVGGLVTGISGLGVGTALATTSSWAGGVLTVTTDGGVTVTCAAGALQVNGADPDNGPASCGTTTQIRVFGDAAVNTIDLSGVFAADFPAGASTLVMGSDGADVITGGELPDTIFGEIGADVITGGNANDVIDGGIGADPINGGNGNDIITGGVGADAIDGGAGTDTLRESADVSFALSDTTLTGLGADTLTSIEVAKLAGGVSANTIDASTFTGPTVLSGGAGDDLLTGGTGNDVLKGSTGADTIDGGAGMDTLMERADVDFTLTDTSLTGLGGDVLNSIERAKLAGGTSSNTIDASTFTGTTVLSGGSGDDVLTGGSGNDRLRGASGADSLTGGNGADVLRAGAGNDSLNSVDGVGNDTDFGDNGLDTCSSDVGDALWSCEL
jgi:Ca2+-binding RTX toxin-like protein